MPNSTTNVLDAEYRGSQQDHQSLRLWLRLLTCTTLVESQLRARLRSEFGSTLPRFDMLAQLQKHPEGLNMGQLSQMMMVSGGNVTGIANQLAKEELIQREVSPEDRRSYVLKLSPKGEKLFAKMATAHEAWVVELFDALAPEEDQELMTLLGKLKQSILSRKADSEG